MNDSTPHTVVAILGMHRSGTSALAGLLNRHGLSLGNVVRRSPHNVRGNHELVALRELHEKILIHSGGGWDQPPANVSWSGHHRDELIDIIRNQNSDIWGFKDPRSLLLLDLWRSLDIPLLFVGTVRHPHNVAHSITTRNPHISLQQAIDLWFRYNRILLRLTEQNSVALVNFDTDSNEYLARVESIAKSLPIATRAVPDNFFEDSLRHWQLAREVSLEPEVDNVYKRLLACCN